MALRLRIVGKPEDRFKGWPKEGDGTSTGRESCINYDTNLDTGIGTSSKKRKKVEGKKQKFRNNNGDRDKQNMNLSTDRNRQKQT